MNSLDVWKICAAMIASFGGSGALLFGLSNYFGKIWADRALEKQRHEYTLLNTQFQHELDLASRKVQVELDAIGLFHKLRTQEEFTRLAALWKKVATLRGYFRLIGGEGASLAYNFPNAEAQHKFEDDKRRRFDTAFSEAQIFLQEEGLFIPKPIVEIAERVLADAEREIHNFAIHRVFFDVDSNIAHEYRVFSVRYLANFVKTTDELELSMRQHIKGTEATQESTQ